MFICAVSRKPLEKLLEILTRAAIDRTTRASERAGGGDAGGYL